MKLAIIIGLIASCIYFGPILTVSIFLIGLVLLHLIFEV